MIAEITQKLDSDFSVVAGELHAFLNPYTYLQLREHPEIIPQFDQIHFDGVFLCRLFALVGLKSMPRRSFDMTSVAKDVFEQAKESGLTIAIVGSEEAVIEEAVERLVDNFGITVIESRHGFFDSEAEIQEYQEKLLDINPDIVVAGMGAVRQERFLAQLKELGWGGTGFTCGGFLHQTAMALEYYPAFFDRMNLRWLYRIIKEPHTLRRYLIDYPKFLFFFSRDYRRWKSVSVQSS